MEKDKHVMPDTSDTFRAKVEREDEEKKDTGIIFGADSRVLSRVDNVRSRSSKEEKRKKL
ncbi:MAG TPA: hypothetical protein GX691_05010 [Clostridia bacterium]|nr:hypothetical protein [Clostridia bacterium]